MPAVMRMPEWRFLRQKNWPMRLSQWMDGKKILLANENQVLENLEIRIQFQGNRVFYNSMNFGYRLLFSTVLSNFLLAWGLEEGWG